MHTSHWLWYTNHQNSSSSTMLYSRTSCRNKPHRPTCLRTCCAYVETVWVHLDQSAVDMAHQWESYPADLACHRALEPVVSSDNQYVPFFSSIEQEWSNISGNGHRYAICVVASYSSVAPSQWHLLLCGWLCVCFFVAGTFTSCSAMQTEFLFIRNSGN